LKAFIFHKLPDALMTMSGCRNVMTPQQGKRKTKSLLDFYTVRSPQVALVSLAPPEKAPIPPKLKYETLHINGFLSNVNVKTPLHERKAPRTNVKPPY